MMGSSCEAHLYIPIPLNAANTPLHGRCKLETRSVSAVVVRKTSILICLHTTMCVLDTLQIGS